MYATRIHQVQVDERSVFQAVDFHVTSPLLQGLCTITICVQQNLQAITLCLH